MVIEIDGDRHIDKEEYDKERQEFLEALGLIVYRISDKDVKTNISGVLIALEDFIVQNYGNTRQQKPPFQIMTGCAQEEPGS